MLRNRTRSSLASSDRCQTTRRGSSWRWSVHPSVCAYCISPRHPSRRRARFFSPSASTAHSGQTLPSPAALASAAAAPVFGHFRSRAAARRTNRRQPSAESRPMGEARLLVAKADKGSEARVRRVGAGARACGTESDWSDNSDGRANDLQPWRLKIQCDTWRRGYYYRSRITDAHNDLQVRTSDKNMSRPSLTGPT